MLFINIYFKYFFNQDLKLFAYLGLWRSRGLVRVLERILDPAGWQVFTPLEVNLEHSGDDYLLLNLERLSRRRYIQDVFQIFFKRIP